MNIKVHFLDQEEMENILLFFENSDGSKPFQFITLASSCS